MKKNSQQYKMKVKVKRKLKTPIITTTNTTYINYILYKQKGHKQTKKRQNEGN